MTQEERDLQKEQDALKIRLISLEKEVALQEERNLLDNKRLRELEDEYGAIKKSGVWHGLRVAKRGVRIAGQLLLRKKTFRQVFSQSSKRKIARKKIKKVKYKLYESGFTSKAVEELESLFLKADYPVQKNEYAWELALWYANQYTHDDAKKALFYLDQLKEKKMDKPFRLKAAVMKAECFHFTGDQEEGNRAIVPFFEDELYPNPNICFAKANLEKVNARKMDWINQALSYYKLANVNTNDGQRSFYDSLTAIGTIPVDTDHTPLVTVIIPAFNAEHTISTSIESLLKQSWDNLELIVVDDCSTDHTAKVVERYELADSRVRLIRAEHNGGAYTARNIALNVANGVFVTINDADDWSHPDKIATQALHLIKNPSVMANTSEQARVTEDMKFYRRGKPGEYIFANMSSLMFRREPVLNKLGYWDSVRFGADGEFKRRVKLTFGNDAVTDLKTGPLSFQRQSKGSLTGSGVFGFHGFFMGARKEYFHSYSDYHQSGKSLYYDFPTVSRPFPVPEPMKINRVKPETRRHFDVIIASEFRLMGGTNMSNVEEIKAQQRYGLRTGLIQMNRYDFSSRKETNPAVRELIDGEQVQMLVYGESVSCDVLIIRHPPVLEELQNYLPDVKANVINVIVNQPPKRDYGSNGRTLYHINQCASHLKHYFGKSATWFPIGPLVRETLYNYHKKELKTISLSQKDWVNIIDINEWQRPKRPKHKDKIIIGRHSRDQYVKWPSNKGELLSIYPDAEPFEVRILGGAEAPKNVLGELPVNWNVAEFGSIHPKEFLASLDVFVYYTHPDWVEAFGRVIFEAMAAGVPVIIPPQYKELFGNAAIYSTPDKVKENIQELMEDEKKYAEQVERATAFVDSQFGYTKHLLRIGKTE